MNFPAGSSVSSYRPFTSVTTDLLLCESDEPSRISTRETGVLAPSATTRPRMVAVPVLRGASRAGCGGGGGGGGGGGTCARAPEAARRIQTLTASNRRI